MKLILLSILLNFKFGKNSMVNQSENNLILFNLKEILNNDILSRMLNSKIPENFLVDDITNRYNYIFNDLNKDIFNLIHMMYEKLEHNIIYNVVRLYPNNKRYTKEMLQNFFEAFGALWQINKEKFKKETFSIFIKFDRNKFMLKRKYQEELIRIKKEKILKELRNSEKSDNSIIYIRNLNFYEEGKNIMKKQNCIIYMENPKIIKSNFENLDIFVVKNSENFQNSVHSDDNLNRIKKDLFELCKNAQLTFNTELQKYMDSLCLYVINIHIYLLNNLTNTVFLQSMRSCDIVNYYLTESNNNSRSKLYEIFLKAKSEFSLHLLE